MPWGDRILTPSGDSLKVNPITSTLYSEPELFLEVFQGNSFFYIAHVEIKKNKPLVLLMVSPDGDDVAMVASYASSKEDCLLEIKSLPTVRDPGVLVSDPPVLNRNFIPDVIRESRFELRENPDLQYEGVTVISERIDFGPSGPQAFADRAVLGADGATGVFKLTNLTQDAIRVNIFLMWTEYLGLREKFNE
jgi:hypothetical protein